MINEFMFVIAQATTSGPSPELWLALLGAVFGGGGVKIIERMLSSSQTRSTLEVTLRNELRGELEGLRIQIKELKQEVKDANDEVRRVLDMYYLEREGRLVAEDRSRDGS